MDLNKAVLGIVDHSATYPRKIDLLFTCDDSNETVELASCEWKRDKVAMDMKLAQQTKNIRTNAAILMTTIRHDVDMTLSMDWIGNSGYLYSMEWLTDKHVFLARTLTNIFVPTHHSDIKGFRKTLQSLFNMKSTLVGNANKIKASLRHTNHRKRLASFIEFETPPSSPTQSHSAPASFILFSPRNNRQEPNKFCYQRDLHLPSSKLTFGILEWQAY
ncbi:hypothetical protein DM01DRAFT_1022928 [Hesseltinella vesiculosa]|uniref:Uncharacterized protein n=1 Tax=Hesseltinella vesiculosa TaxID=101127 RepID=A0A1X2GJS2_9FUNG|nr:hypothetical protein DM01DRAFT_1022928 [Hesseltinella vesiculosa]